MKSVNELHTHKSVPSIELEGITQARDLVACRGRLCCKRLPTYHVGLHYKYLHNYCWVAIVSVLLFYLHVN